MFQFNYEPNCKGSGSRLHRPYCTDECAVAHRKLMSHAPMPSRLVKTCVEYGDEFYVPKCHNNRKLCSNACRHKYTAKALTKNELRTLTCVQCLGTFSTKNVNRRFCSPKCFAASRFDRHTLVCEVCSEPIVTKKSYVPRFCSKRCTREAQSRDMVASHVNGRSCFRSDILNSPYFKSSFEADYYRYCLHLGKMPFYEHRSFHVVIDGKEKCYTPDFWFSDEDRYVELKGVREGKSRFSKLLNSNARSREVVVASGQRIDVVYMNDFYGELRRQGLYHTIANLEHRDYAGTQHLISKHGQN
jgi:hypothetical protein